MISVLTYDMLNIADISEILGLYKNGIKENDKCEVYCLDDNNIEKLNEVMSKA